MKKQMFEISIDHKMLAAAKQCFDACLKEAVNRAITTGSMEGSATVKISFDLFKTVDQDTNEEMISPEFKFKATFSVPMKGGADGKIIEKSRIKPKEDGMGWILVNDQVTMDELMDDEDE